MHRHRYFVGGIVIKLKVKVKCTLVQALRLCTGSTAHRGSRGTALPFFDHCTRSEWGVRVTPRPLFTPGKDLVPIVQETGWAPGPVWTGVENIAPKGIRSSDCPARSQSLYQVSYPGPQVMRLRDGKSNAPMPAAAIGFIFSETPRHSLRPIQTPMCTEELFRG